MFCCKPFERFVMTEEIPEHLKNEYKSDFPNILNEVHQLIETFKGNKNQENLTKLKVAVHKIAGTAGVFGFNKTSDIAKQWEHVLDTKLSTFSAESCNDPFIEDNYKRFEELKGSL